MSAEDAASVLQEVLYNLDNLPAEVAFLLGEIAHKDERAQGKSSHTAQSTLHSILVSLVPLPSF